jgi:hypothetical protein
VGAADARDEEPRVLHLAPHPDDELIGAPATLMALRDGGWRVVNLACSLGALSQKERRERELRDACSRARFEVRVADTIDSDSELSASVRAAIEDLEPALVVAPSPHDAHPGHEAVGRAAVAACESRGLEPALCPRLWLWGLWADLPFPTLAVAFGQSRMDEIFACLDAHSGELERNDYRRLVHGRAEMNSSLGPERVFGFGSSAAPGSGGGYVELVTELLPESGTWRLGARRWLDPADPLGEGRDGSSTRAGAAEPDAHTLLDPPSPAGTISDWLHRRS